MGRKIASQARFADLGTITTDRLLIEDWQSVLSDHLKRKTFEAALAASLTPQITRHLPLDMAFPVKGRSIADWITDREEEAHVLHVSCRDTDAFAGLILLHDVGAEAAVATVYLGYFLREECWGRGYASEAISALVTAFEAGPPRCLIAGVDKSNQASVRVLEKSGFKLNAAESSDSRCFFHRLVG